MPTLHRPSRGLAIALAASLGLALLLALGFALGEARGWPFLIEPLQAALTQRLGRSVQLLAPPAGSGGAAATGQRAAAAAASVPLPTTGAAPSGVLRPAAGRPSPASGAQLRFWGGLSLHTAWLEVAAPSWSHAASLVSARDVDVRLRYIDLWRAWRGQQLVVRELRAAWLQATLERRADGQASWQLPGRTPAPPLPRVESLDLSEGLLHYSDALRPLELQAQAAVHGGSLALHVQATSAGARLLFDGGATQDAGQDTAPDAIRWNRLQGRFTLQGPSLAEVGVPLGMTLPTTGAFKAQGQLQHSDKLSDIVLAALQVGSSRLAGHFVFDTRKSLPLLSGTLTGARLSLRDLGPAVGAEPVPVPGRSRVLPKRAFDLASLRAMNADVQIALGELDLNTPRLEPLRPLNARLLLEGGVLTLKDLDAHIGAGQLRGTLSLDGQQDRAHWVAAVAWSGVSLAQWIHQPRSKSLPPYVSGMLQGHAEVQGLGRSTAEILATLQGRMYASVQGGTLSHLLVEAAGLHVVETLGAYLGGDRSLPLRCAVADLRVSQGTVQPQVLVLDTSDATLWLEGTLSLAQESLDLRAVVAPRDFSPLSLRTPLHVGGSFAAPQVSVAQGPLGRKLGAALLLGLINPLAAWLPLLDVGNREAALRNTQACQAALQQPRRPAPKPGAAP